MNVLPAHLYISLPRNLSECGALREVIEREHSATLAAMMVHPIRQLRSEAEMSDLIWFVCGIAAARAINTDNPTIEFLSAFRALIEGAQSFYSERATHYKTVGNA